jgi:cytosine/adenosine deaminase-related metal-dependent hydrolase
VDSGSVVGHLLFGLGAADVRDVWVGGHQVMADGVVLAATRSCVEEIGVEARRLWSAFEREATR